MVVAVAEPGPRAGRTAVGLTVAWKDDVFRDAAHALFIMAPRVPAAAIDNPHDTDNCPNCHLKTPDKGPAGVIDYSFLAEDIDPTCLICHRDSCCTTAKRPESTHASGIDCWDKKKVRHPEEAPPLGQLHHLPHPPLRKARRQHGTRGLPAAPAQGDPLTGMDWTVLRHDCHADL
jgi:hypothetical protein